MKKILAGIIACCVVGGVLPSVDMVADNAVIIANAEDETEKSGTCGENVTWVLNNDGTLIISGTGDMEDYGYGYYNNIWCVSKPTYASKCELIKKVIIEDGVTSIGNESFFRSEYENLTEVIISDSVKNIGIYAFAGCNNLTKIVIPESTTDIEVWAFSGTKWIAERSAENEFVVINGTLVEVNCTGDIIIPNNVIRVPMSVLDYCKATSIVFPENVTEIGANAFCPNLKSITVLNADCNIYNLFYNKRDIVKDIPYFDGGIVYGYEGSTAQKYAEECGYTFESLGEAPQTEIDGDANGDGIVNVSDAVILQKWLLGSGSLTNWENVDLCKDGKIDVFDMIEMRKLIVKK